jgi:hypothetical protein
MDTATALDTAIEVVGLGPLSEIIDVTPQRLHNWRQRGLPRTEWTGETRYAEKIAAACRAKGRRDVTKKQLLAQRAA